ncbi:MAG: hypothetical protein PVH52_01205 [bacterium]|jgi:hypothetical protein
MYKKAALLITVVAIIGIAFAGVSFGMKPGQGRVPNGPSGASHISHLYFNEKDPDTWEIVEGGAWGKMRYSHEAAEFNFNFNGHGLEAGMDYTLIYYPDPWPGSGLICLGEGTADIDGNVHIKNAVDTGDLPTMDDENYPDGAKIWLVLTSDVDCIMQEMVGWNPVEYLFEYDLITFDDTDF